MAFDLVISDAHVSPEQNLERFEALGNLIVEEQPDNIIVVGDIPTFDSCSYWDEDPWEEYPTLQEDIDVTKEALKIMFKPLQRYNTSRRKTKRKQYNPGTFYAKGNHEDRLARRIKDDPDLLGSIINDINSYCGFDSYFQSIVDYGYFLTVNGIQYTHAPFNKLNRPMTGLYRGRKIALESDTHTIYGHTHTGDFTIAPLIGGNGARCSLNCPAFMEEDNMESYAEPSQTGWTYGLVRVYPSHSSIKPFSFDWLTTKRLKELYL